jgi:hypothetical protein
MYMLVSLFVHRSSLKSFATMELAWLAFSLLPVVFLPATARKARDRATAGQAPRLGWPSQELALPVVLEDGRTVVLKPQTVAESVYAAGDEKLTQALFGGGASLESVRRMLMSECQRLYSEACREEGRGSVTAEELRRVLEAEGRRITLEP